MKIGIIGLGHMGKNHLKELKNNSNFKLNALFDIQKFSSDIPFFDNLDDFLKQDNDIVIIATPTFTHLDIAKKVLPKVKTVLIEKPLAMNLKEIKEFEKYSKSHDNNIAVGFCERFNPCIRALKKILDNELLISINIQRFSSFPQRIQDVGILQDLAVHDLDLLHFLSNQKISEVKILKNYTQECHQESESIISCKMQNFIACLHQSWNSTQKIRKIQIITNKHFYEADLINLVLLKDNVKIELEKHSTLFKEHEDLFKFALNQKNDLASIQDAFLVQEILEKHQ
ncbi:Gfo/Idh/MocA family protein [Campylobacter novaezeelandiae]|uniref:Gfo/Idh/MocA family protein n=1 Tax=Campylobacter novaezeelandiae TaxID=2267891 RepID=UPI00190550CD|nr:Gfo/Idh/MocA family oxidoreductase [Campylobacter novaezeelandiae]MBK1964646.1 Gfo/Idh/MocA family oxidoreductase [Campylobacter novaezeelandiae]MBK1993285.1 Gfo/Idh/MocA family oxidoreductase [Campylobacter novaezeelandiae]